jgi:ribosome-associated heat shock protein Hsp15
VTAATATDRARGRLDQWLWFARFVKSRSLAARLCAAGLIAVNGTGVTKPSHSIRVGDVVVLPQGRWQRTIRIVAIGDRRGPAPEARQLYAEIAPATPVAEQTPKWLPLLDETLDLDYRTPQTLPGPMSR